MTIRMRHTRSHTNKRRSHHALKESASVKCPKCGEVKTAHRVCPNCGAYAGRTVLDVLKKLTKKEKKKKEKELQEQEKTQSADKSLDAAELSKK